jgi:hypothetical protein
MDFLKRHMLLIICAVAAAGGVALGVSGFRSMPAVQEEMKKAESVYRSLDNLQSKPVNRARLDAELRRIELIKEDHARIIDQVKSLFGWEMLVPQVLPYSDSLKRLEFKRKYVEAMRGFIQVLTSGGPATDVDIRNMRDRIANEEAAVREYQLNPNPLIPPPTIYTGPPRTPAGVLTRAGAQKDAIARAHIQAAQRIYCYTTDAPEGRPQENVYPSFEIDPVMADVDSVDAPFPDEVWHAQLGYWIQKDIVSAIAAVNEAAAEAAVAGGDYGWVGNMPVKEVISVRLHRGFVPPQGERFYSDPISDPRPSIPPGTPETVFTHSGSGESFDVVQFTVKLIMDQREVQKFVHQLCLNRMYVPLRVAYSEVPPNRDMIGKIYGSGPVVRVVFDFEVSLPGQLFRRLMPQFLREQNGVICREVDECPVEPS